MLKIVLPRVLVLTLLFGWSCTVQAETPDIQSLHDGQTLRGWRGNTQYWRVEEGAITGEIPSGEQLEQNQFLYWEGRVADFELQLEFRIRGVADANSGIQFRSQEQAGGHAVGYQADIDLGTKWLGCIYDEHGRGLIGERGHVVSIAPDGRRWKDPFDNPPEFATLFQANQWNTYRILATGPHLEVWINGQRVSVLDDHQTGEAEHAGLLALQLHSGRGPVKVQFRNLHLKALGKTPLPKSPPSAADPEDRQSQSPVLWHLRRNPAPASLVDNTEAQSVVAGMMVSEGFEVDLIAAEPDVHQPIAFTIDRKGRLWIAEAFSYPNKQPAGAGKDRILILADQDGDGTWETRKTFFEGLNLVSGIEVGFGGVWIGAAPELLFIPDKNGDDVPDGEPEVLLNGFGYQDTHETLNNFTWGPDGWLYGNQGVFNTAQIGKPGAPESERQELRAGVWRYHPLRHEFEVFAHGGSNQWGLAFNAAGDLFMTHCRSYWGGGGTTYVIWNGHYWNQANAHYPEFISNSAPAGMPHLRNYLPASARYDSGEGGAGKRGTRAVYGGHSHVGTMIYGGDNWPSIYRDRLFTHNLHGHQINQQINVPQGSAYETFHAGYDLAYVPDPAYVAVDLKYGPDGAVYMIDWVDLQHCHNPRPENWDRTNGRVYRMCWAETYRPVQVDLGAKSDAELVDLLQHPNRWFADTARRTLQERASQRPLDEALVQRLRTTVHSSSERQLRLEALWTLHVTGNLDAQTVDMAFSSPDEVLCSWAVRLAAESAGTLGKLSARLEQLSSDHRSPKVRLAIASVLPRIAAADRWTVVEALAQHAEDAGDRFLPDMIWYGLAPVVDQDIPRAMALARSTPLPSLSDSILWYLARGAAGRDALAAFLATAPNDDALHTLRVIHFSLINESRLPSPDGWQQVVKRDDLRHDAAAQAMLEDLSAVFGDEAVLEQLRLVLSDDDAAVAERRRALKLLNRVGDQNAIDVYQQLLDHDEFRSQVIPLLARSSDPNVAQQLLDRFANFNEADRNAALAVLTSRAEFASDLMKRVETGQLDPGNLTALQIRRMHDLQDAQLIERLEKVWGTIGVSSEQAQATIAKIKRTYTTAPLWAYSAGRGQQVFQKNCANCHPMDGTSVPLGPSLKGSWRNGLDYFLENIVDPNAVVGENYRTTLVVTDSGQIVTGLLDSETDTTLVLRTAEETIAIPKSEIEERRLSDQSLMPAGLLDNLSEFELIELFKYLLQPE